MKKFFNLFLFVLLIFTWKIFLDSNSDAIEKYNFHKNRADKFYQMTAYKDSFEEYEKALKFSEKAHKSEIYLRQVQIILMENEFSKAMKLIDKGLQEDVEIKSAADLYLKTCLKEEKYKEMNQFIDFYKSEVELSKFEEDIFARYYYLPGQYKDIKQIGDKMFLVSDDSKDYILDENGRKLFTSRQEKILGFDETNKLVTLIDGDRVKLVDFKKNIRASLDNPIEYPYLNGYYIKDSKLKNQLGEVFFQGEKLSNISEEIFASYSNNTISLFDLSKKKLLTLKANDVIKDKIGRAVIDGKLIYESKKERMYDFKNEIFSDYYDQIDFSKGEEIAVKKGNLWGFIDQDFKLKIKPSYTKASSFANGLALVEKNGKMLLIDASEKIRTEFTEKDLIAFNNQGVGFVKKDGYWQMIKLIRMVR